MRRLERSWSRVDAAVVVIALVAVLGSRSARSAQSTTTSKPYTEAHKALQARLGASERALTDRSPAIEARLEAIAADLDKLEKGRTTLSESALAERKAGLEAERAALQNELRYLESAKTAWQAAVDASQSAAGFRRRSAQFETDQQRKPAEFVPADVERMKSDLTRVQGDRVAIEKGETARSKRLADLAGQLDKGDGRERPALLAEQAALQAETEEARHKRAALDAERALLTARLEAAGRALGDSTSTQPTTTSTAPAPEKEEAAARAKKKLAEKLQAEARDRLGYAQARLEEVQSRLEAAAPDADHAAQLENDREYWQRVEAYEKRRIEQAELHKRTAQGKQEIAQLLERIKAAGDRLDQLGETRSKMPLASREEQAAKLRSLIDEARARADALDLRAKAENDKVQPMQQRLLSLEAVEQGLLERLEKARPGQYENLTDHYHRMKGQLEVERQQADLTIMTMENIAYALKRQATLERELAGLYAQSAEVLVPTQPPFWDRHRKTVNSVWIAVVVVGITYAVKLIVWLIKLLIARLGRLVSAMPARFSVKRIGTLASFAGSIIKLFVWIFGAITVLNEFGIDYAKSTGAIGLIGLIMAGMFREIVVDFVKGLDIIAGGHYNVGDFVEVDGKCGHVVDFSVKHTRIRTLSGQEHNIPNSRCVPSRRFPDGYVNNYVDVPVKSATDEQRVRELLVPICEDLRHRIEPVRDVPALAVCFDGPGGRVTMRYRLRVLPGCDWVVADHFIPAVKQTLAEAGIELVGEPTFFFLNRLKTFRKLFSRQLNEEQISQELDQEEAIKQRLNAERGPSADDSAARIASPGPDDPPSDGRA